MRDKRLLALLIPVAILSGCANTAVQTVRIDSFCENKYQSKRMKKEQFEAIDRIRKYPAFKPVIDELINHWAMGEREYENCHGK